MLSFDVSDKQINIVKGDNAANKIKIEKSFTLEIPEDQDYILNGEVINLTGLAEYILTNLKAENMMDKDAVVTFSSSNVVFKELIVPNAKGEAFLTMVQNTMSHEMGITDDYSISYTKVGAAGEDNPGAVKVLATACPSSLVDSYRKLFTILNIQLKSVNIGCNSIARIVLADKSNLDKMPLLVCQLDKNFLGLTLFENGQMAFARYVPISEEDYGSADYILEALNENIFKMEQFNKARGGSGLSNVILYGVIDDYIKVVDALDGLVAQVSVLSVPAQISGFENFEFTVFANAIGALYRRNKDTERINLLEVDQMQGKGSGGGVSSLMVTAGIIAVASIVAIGAITAVVKIRTSSLESDIKEDEKQIDDLNEKLKGNELLKVQLTAIQAYDTAVKDERAALTSWPKFDNNLKKKIDEAFKKVNNAEYKGLEYDLSEGKITLTEVTVKEQEDATDLVRALKDVKDDSKKDGKFFTAVSFDGFSKDDDNKYSLGDLEVTINLDAASDEEAEDKKEDTKEEAAK
ncbi:pilus assembly protein PilM [Ruminococcus sp. NK3A76]|uniref:pilus assembly protein PilM n=1 Tax=Ruminococcus sp. NK3A76 TaxID=877411 RepID=UPI000ABB8001|nr:pilus assembly protein PilM [Ruminococcus sp. NK3A76]